MSVTLKRWPPQVPHAGDFWGKHEARIWTQRIPRESLGYPGVRCLRKGQNDNTELNISSTSNLWYIRLSQSWCFGRKTLIRLSRHEAIRTEAFGFAFQSANVIFSFFGGDALRFAYSAPKHPRPSTKETPEIQKRWCCLFAMHQFVISKSIINTLFLQTTMTCAKSYEKSCEL